MAVVGDNPSKMTSHRSIDGSGNKMTVRFNLEFLKGCSFHCPGCYVNRDNAYSDHDLDVVYKSFNDFKNGGFIFDEIILGPTDFFAAYNSEELVQNPKFIRFFEEPVVLTLLSTLQSDSREIERRIGLINKNLGSNLEIEILIPFEVSKILAKDADYVEMLKGKMQLLQKFDADVVYALQMNIQDTSYLKGFNLKEVSDYVWKEFGTITEFNPSFLRHSNSESISKTIQSWNEMLNENFKSEYIKGHGGITFTMADPYHVGFNSTTYNYHKGFFYSCPFIYENVFDRNDYFKISPSGNNGLYNLEDFIGHRHSTETRQLEYLRKTKECANCPHSMNCVSKQVIDYMNYKDVTGCILAKDVLDLYTTLNRDF